MPLTISPISFWAFPPRELRPLPLVPEAIFPTTDLVLALTKRTSKLGSHPSAITHHDQGTFPAPPLGASLPRTALRCVLEEQDRAFLDHMVTMTELADCSCLCFNQIVLHHLQDPRERLQPFPPISPKAHTLPSALQPCPKL